MTARIPLPDGWAGRPIRVGDAVRAGVGTSRLDGGDLDRPFWGVRTPVRETAGGGMGHISRNDVEALCQALLVRMPRGAFFSHATAALLLGLPVPSRLARLRPLHVGVLAPARAMDARDVVGHRLRLAPDDLVERGVLLLTGPARTWLDLAAVLTLGELVAIGDHLLYWESPIVTRGELSAAVEGYSGRRGLQRARAALPLLRTRSESPRLPRLQAAHRIPGRPPPHRSGPVALGHPPGRPPRRPRLAGAAGHR